MIGRVIWIDSVDHDDLGLVARVSLRMEDESRRDCFIRGVKPWGYVHEHETLPDREWIVDVEHGYQSLFGDSLKRVTTTLPEKVNDRNDDDTLMDHVKEGFEADIPFYRKLSIIDNINGYIELPEEPVSMEGDVYVYDIGAVKTEVEYEDYIEPRIMISDIEVSVDEELSFEEMRDNSTQPINVICSYDTYEEDYVVFYYDKYENLNDTSRIREIVDGQLDTDIDIELRKSPTEVDMFNAFINYMNRREFDLTTGWNWVDFDYEYIINRADVLDDINKHRMSPFGYIKYTNNKMMQIPGRPGFDMMDAFCDKMTATNWRSKSLDYVCREELGIGKVEDVDINWAWENDAEKLLGYNIVDVALCVELDKANDIHKFYYDLSQECSVPIYDAFYELRLVDGYVMSRRDENEILPNADQTELIDNAGGYVEDPVNGRHRNIGVADLKSLYPSAMITWNISTETISDSPDDFDNYVKVPWVPEPKEVEGDITEDQIEWDWLYCSLDQQGLIARTVRGLFKKRNHEKARRSEFESNSLQYSMWDRMQRSTKEIMNSFYGNASSKYWRLANKWLGDAITSAARYTLWKGKQAIQKIGYKGTYGDTDSHFLQLKSDSLGDQVDELKEVAEYMDDDASTIAQDIGIDGTHPYLQDGELHGDEYTCMVWEPEKIYETWMQLGKKKRYAGMIVWKEGKYLDEPEISITGFEYRRADSMEVTEEMQQEVIEMILRGAEFQEVSEYIMGVIDEIDKNSDDIRKFALPGSINKDLDDYPNRQVPRACKYSNAHLGYEFSEGDDPFVYLIKDTPSGLPKSDVVAFEWHEEIPEGFVLNTEAIIERGIRKPIDLIINEVGWKFSEIRAGMEQQTMDLSNDGANPFA